MKLSRNGIGRWRTIRSSPERARGVSSLTAFIVRGLVRGVRRTLRSRTVTDIHRRQDANATAIAERVLAVSQQRGPSPNPDPDWLEKMPAAVWCANSSCHWKVAWPTHYWCPVCASIDEEWAA